MGKFTAFDPDSEVSGRSVLAFIHCTKYEEIAPYLEKQGLLEVDPDLWYPVQAWLDVLRDIAEEAEGLDMMFDFISIGMKIGEMAPLPPEWAELPLKDALLASSGAGYRMNHRGDVGEIAAREIGDRHIQIMFRTPYPDDLFYGTYYGIAQRFMPANLSFNLSYDPSEPRGDDGGERTILNLTWR
jgi:hypothetical protein